ncbi:hypothetical protein L914_11710 [Phytophthora nicotianae]|uniref:Uncharacterized protein n=1 Tax=Phytophthora nicotianae TaxID=4792 RepID=W2N480_PHYNI|nr:hypothetical protein L914_11710 [Phytophthora nicotianae]
MRASLSKSLYPNWWPMLMHMVTWTFSSRRPCT